MGCWAETPPAAARSDSYVGEEAETAKTPKIAKYWGEPLMKLQNFGDEPFMKKRIYQFRNDKGGWEILIFGLHKFEPKKSNFSDAN